MPPPAAESRVFGHGDPLLAVGTAACTAVFSFVYTLLLRPLPVPRPHDVVSVYSTSPEKGGFGSLSMPDYRDLAMRDDLFEALGAYVRVPLLIDDGDRTERVLGEIVTGNFLHLLGLRPAVGRLLTPADDAADATTVAVLSYRAWQQRFAANPDVLGRVVRIDAEPVEIVGVTPASFRGIVLDWGGAPDLWVPVSHLRRLSPAFARASVEENRGTPWLQAAGRLREGMTAQAAGSALREQAARLAGWRRMTMTRPFLGVTIRALPVVLVAVAGVTAALSPAVQHDALGAALTFHAPFDGRVDAAHAAGDPRLYWAPSFKQRQEAKPGLPDGEDVRLAPGAGRFGDALRFTKKASSLVFFRGARNMPYQASNWSGTVSFWLSVDPANDLEPGFCDPVQITPRAWNDAAFFVEFEKRPESIPFRLGVYADFSVWNPEKRRFDDIPAGERPLVTVDDPPFSRGRWTHVVFTFERFNTGRPDGVARLYLDGTPQGELGARQQTFTWDPEQNTIVLGLSYVGLLDDLSIFNRALTGEEIVALYGLSNGVAALTGAR